MGSIKRNPWKIRAFCSQFFSVLSFTIMQVIKGKRYLRLTIGLMFLFFAITFCGSIIFVHSGQEEKASSIEKVWMEEGTLIKDFLAFNEDTLYHNIKVKVVPDTGKVSTEQLGSQDILVQVQEQDETYCINGILSEDSRISQEEAKEFLDVVKESFYHTMISESGISRIQLELLKKDRIGNIYVAGDSEHGIEWILTVSVPIFVGILIYLLMVMYGQSVMMEVSSEKTSKLMETMLVDVYPEALVSGKILGTAFLGILQVLLWIGGLIYGLATGVLVGNLFFPEESDSYGKVLEILKSYGLDVNLTSGLLMAIVIIILGILLYCFLAGIPGSLIAKPEHAGNVQQLVQIPLMICFMVTYFAIFMEKKELLVFLRYFPFTAPFVLPGELLVGTCSIGIGWIVSGLLLIAVIVLGTLAGKIYKYKALHSGKQ